MNSFLKENEVVVAIKDHYTDNNGYDHIAVIWNGNSVREENYSNGYNNVSFDSAQVNASQEQTELAAKWCMLYTQKDRHTLGQIWTVKGSRKLENGTIVKVISTTITTKVQVITGTCGDKVGGFYNISPNCLDEFVIGKAPYWCDFEGKVKDLRNEMSNKKDSLEFFSEKYERRILVLKEEIAKGNKLIDDKKFTGELSSLLMKYLLSGVSDHVKELGTLEEVLLGYKRDIFKTKKEILRLNCFIA